MATLKTFFPARMGAGHMSAVFSPPPPLVHHVNRNRTQVDYTLPMMAPSAQHAHSVHAVRLFGRTAVLETREGRGYVAILTTYSVGPFTTHQTAILKRA